MADNPQKGQQSRSVKGILKSSSFDQNEPSKSNKEMKWDEMNILATYHPADKDYGHMKIDEPKTPFTYYKGASDEESNASSRDAKSDDEADADVLDADLLAKKIQLSSSKPPKAMMEFDSDEEGESSESKKAFEQKRKLHYNEFYAIKLARKLMEQEKDDEESSDHDDKAEKLESPPPLGVFPPTSSKNTSESRQNDSPGNNATSEINTPETPPLVFLLDEKSEKVEKSD